MILSFRGFWTCGLWIYQFEYKWKNLFARYPTLYLSTKILLPLPESANYPKSLFNLKTLLPLLEEVYISPNRNPKKQAKRSWLKYYSHLWPCMFVKHLFRNKTQNHKIYMKEQIACKLKKQHHVPSPTMQKINNHICILFCIESIGRGFGHTNGYTGTLVKTRVSWRYLNFQRTAGSQFFKYFRIRRWLVLVVWKILESKNHWLQLPISRTLKEPAVFMKEYGSYLSPVLWFFWELWLYTRTGSLIFTNLRLWRSKTKVTRTKF